MKKLFLSIILGGSLLQGCGYLDVIPDNVPTLDHSFANEVTTRNYLFTCYSGLPSESDIYNNPSFLSGDEYWSWESLIGFTEEADIYRPWMIGRGLQNTNAPYLNKYETDAKSGGLWGTIRKCNTFIERVDNVLGLKEVDARRWKAEAKVIKAYCHFYLMRMYGPIPVIRDNMEINADPEMVRFKRSTWDECVNYVVQLLDEATPDLPPIIFNRTVELGRMTQLISLSLKARVLVTSASPQFNGNSFYESFKNKDGQALFASEDKGKWAKAAQACKEAIDACEANGAKLYEYSSLSQINPLVKSEYTIRGSVTDKNWSDELIWGSVKGPGGIQKYAQAYIDPVAQVGGHVHLVLAVPMKIAKQYYTKNGVPIEEDKEWVGKNLESLRTATTEENDVIRGKTAELNFNREPRFYASLGFDRGVWYGAGKPNNAAFTLQGLFGEQSNGGNERTCVTGYWAKKLINLESAFSGKLEYAQRAYAWPIIRLADIYLLYAEALNESNAAPTAQVYDFVDKVRKRAGLKGVVESWKEHSTAPGKVDTQEGMREIIQKERLIELSLEGQRFWDLRRWLLTAEHFEQPITGWNRTAKTSEEYYQEVTLATQQFTAKDYLWPISVSLLNRNPNLVQTIGW